MPKRALRIADPCKQDWDALPRTERGFFCPECRKEVHDLAGMTRREADAYRARFEAPICVRVRRGEDGAPAYAPDLTLRTASRGTALLAAAALAACNDPSAGSSRETPPAVVVAAPPAAPAPVPSAAPPTPTPTPQPLPPPPPGPEAPATPDVIPTPEEEARLREEHSHHHHRHAKVRVNDHEFLGGLEAL